MNYTSNRKNISSGDVLAWSHTNWDSFYDFQIQLIRIFTRSEYNHVGIAWVVGDRVFVIEAVPPEVRIYPLSKLTPFYHIPCGKSYWNNQVEEKALSFVGYKYSNLEAIKAFFNNVIVGNNNVWQCAELANAILSEIPNWGSVLSVPSNIVKRLAEKGYPISLINNVKE